MTDEALDLIKQKPYFSQLGYVSDVYKLIGKSLISIIINSPFCVKKLLGC